MRLLQGWRVKFYTFVTLFIFISGSLAALLWPKSPVAFVQKTPNKNIQILQPIKDISKDVKDEQTVKNDSTTSTSSRENESPKSAPGQVQGQSTDSSGQDGDKQGETGTAPNPIPTPNPNPIIKVDPPAIVDPPYTPPCGGCGQVSLVKGILCPMTQDSSLSAQVCLDRL